MNECIACDMDGETRTVLLEKSVDFRMKFDPEYFRAKEPPMERDFILACEAIKSLAGLVEHLLERDEI